MSGYSESALLRKLAELKISAPSIQGVALWIMHHKKHYRATVRTWYRHLVAAQSGHKLTLLYLANDVVQNCRKKQPEIEAEFGLVMKKVFTHLAGESLDEKIVTRMTRLVNVWKERAIFDRKVQEEVAKVWASRGKEKEGSNGPPAKKAKVEKPTRELEEKEDADEEEDVVSGLALVRRMASERERQGEGEEGSLSRLEEEVRERRRLGEALADLVRRQQEELQQAEEQLVRMRARQCGYHQPKPHEIQRRHDFDQTDDYEELHDAGGSYDRYPPALPTKPHGASADGWGLVEENDNSGSHNESSVPTMNHSEAEIESSTEAYEPPKDNTALSDEPEEEAAKSDSQQSEKTILTDIQVQGERIEKPDKHIDNSEQSNLQKELLSPGSEEENAELENGITGSEEGNTKPEDGNPESEPRRLGPDELVTDQLPVPSGDSDQKEEPQDVDLTSQIEEAEVEELGTGLDKPDPDQDIATGFDSEPESDSDPNTLTEEAEGRAAEQGESMPILT